MANPDAEREREREMPTRFALSPRAGAASRPHPGVDELAAQRALIEALMDPAAYPHPVSQVRLFETHISYVLLTGRFAYKIKKAVDLGFLDFTTLDRRRFFCEEELRLNRRLAPELYLSVVTIGGAAAAVHVGDASPAVEYAVKMTEFDQGALLDQRLVQGLLLPAHIDMLADRVAAFHDRVVISGAADEYGTPAAVWRPVNDNFDQLRAMLPDVDDRPATLALLDELECWSDDEFARLTRVLAARKRDGLVRECHGDLHLGNIAWFNGAPQIFDGIEFDPNLRWIDVMNEVAFVVMDLDERGRPDYAHRFLDRYLQASGDYAGLQVLPFYRVYRALVRAKVACIRAAQEAPAARQALVEVCARYLACARHASQPQPRFVALMHGLSGSGKTTVSQAVLERTGAVRLRSDVERKRLSGLPPLARSEADAGRGIYAADATEETYRHLVDLLRTVVGAGFPVVVDAASLKAWQRELFRQAAQALGVPFRLLSCQAAEPVLLERLAARARRGRDASDANAKVLAHQRMNDEPLSPAEVAAAWFVDEGPSGLPRVLRKIVESLR